MPLGKSTTLTLQAKSGTSRSSVMQGLQGFWGRTGDGRGRGHQEQDRGAV